MSHPDGRWQALVGQHRYAVISALGKPLIDIRVESFVGREEVMLWLGVVSGLFTPAAALEVFDACFSSAEDRTGLDVLNRVCTSSGGSVE
ncbi:hypothetical protein [Halomonas sp. DQ26W]|uniref:hypothetical protein n=1 Tax=Halomonas sp. DQ26W TaxID=2282311 RepID=UPI0011C05BE3|nr:hypothetical protein [Halomonas sp. DQ26W]